MEAAAGEIEAEQMELIAPQTAEEAAALEENRAALDTLRHQLEVVDAIEERMKKLDSLEMELTQGFTPEAYRVYRQVTADLEEHGGRPARAARISAAIFARHAQIVAETRQRNGEAGYTALDYAKTYRMGDAGEGALGQEGQTELDKYLAAEPVRAEKGTIQKSESKTAMEVAAEWAKEHLPVEVPTVFGTLTIDAVSIKDSLSHGFGQKKLDAIPTLPEGMKKAAFLGESKDSQGKPLTHGYFCYPIEYEGKRQVVFCRVRKDTNVNRLYIHEVFEEKEIESIPLQTVAKLLRSKPHGGNAFYKAIIANFFRTGKNEETNIESLDQTAWHGSPYKRDDGKEHLTIEKGKFTGENGKKAMQNALDWFVKNYPKGTVAATVIGDVQITKSGIKDSLSHGFSQKKLDVIPSITFAN